MNERYEGMSMAGPSRVVPSRNEQDDEEDYGFRFGQLTMDDERFNPPSYGFNPSAPAFNGRPSYTASGGVYQQHPTQSPMYSTPSSPYIPHQHHLQHHPLQAQTPFIPYQHWSSPPMSPAMSSHQQYAAGRARHGSFAEDMRMTQPPWTPNQGQPRGYPQLPSHQINPTMHHQSPSMAPSAWTSPSAPSSYQFYTPHQQYQTQFETPSPNVPMTPKFRNRMSWSGPPGKLEGADKERERKAYHPQAPAKRSDWVMWVGNVPQNTSHEELWRYFNQTIPPGDEEWKGPSSIFLISRSSCAFVNLSSQADLDRAVAFFNGRPLRAFDTRCPRMVCRVRRKDDDLRAGVGAQRGTGMHREWIKNMGGGGVAAVQVDITNTGPLSPGIPLSPAAMELAPEGEGRRRESIVDAAEAAAAAADAKHKSSNSYASTNSSFLVRHFPKRVFILKSSTQAELEESVQTGTWRTQKHNEPILDQAYRTAPEVYLIFGANKAGEFFGYAKMTEPIDKEKAAARAAKLAQSQQVQPPSAGDQRERASISSSRPASQFASDRPTMMSPQSSSSAVPMASPGCLTPGTEEEPNFDINSIMTDGHHPKPRYSDGHHSIASAPADLRPTTLDPKLLQQSSMSRNIAALRAEEGSTLDPKLLQQSHMAAPIAAIRAAEGSTAKQLAQGSSDRAQEMDDQGVLRKDTIPSPHVERNEAGAIQQDGQDDVEDQREGAEDNKGFVFKIDWVRVGAVPFGRTRHLRNPWNTDKEVKVSRDGTEVEPNVGSLLMAEWDKA